MVEETGYERCPSGGAWMVVVVSMSIVGIDVAINVDVDVDAGLGVVNSTVPYLGRMYCTSIYSYRR